jgi:hypothetical protein
MIYIKCKSRAIVVPSNQQGCIKLLALLKQLLGKPSHNIDAHKIKRKVLEIWSYFSKL